MWSSLIKKKHILIQTWKHSRTSASFHIWFSHLSYAKITLMCIRHSQSAAVASEIWIKYAGFQDRFRRAVHEIDMTVN